MSALRASWLVARREWRADLRHPDGIATALTFIAALVLIESLLLGPLAARSGLVVPALYWISLLFAATVVAERSFERELVDDALDAVRVLPAGRDALYAGKVIALSATLAPVALAGALLGIVLLDVNVALPLVGILSMLVGVVALSSVVVLDVALTLRLRSRAALVPVLAAPVLVPQLVAAVNATAAAIAGDPSSALLWGGLLVASAIVYAVVGLTIAGTAIE